MASKEASAREHTAAISAISRSARLPRRSRLPTSEMPSVGARQRDVIRRHAIVARRHPPIRLMAAACALAFVATASGSSAAISNLAPPTRAHVDHVDAPFSLDARLVASLASRVGNDTSPGDALPGGEKLHNNCQPREVEPDQRCAYVTQTPSCAKEDHFVHYLRLHYCLMARAPVASAFAQLALALFFCFVLANVAERFFCPALANVSAALRLPEDVAGATLLSFGNGAPDVFAQIESVSKANADTVSLGIGAALGAGFFVCGCVFPVVALISPTPGDEDDEAEVAPASGANEREPFVERYPWSRFIEWMRRGGIKTRSGPFARDSSFYVVAVASVFYIFRGGDVTFTRAAALSTLYVVYVISVAAPSRIAARFRARESESSSSGPGARATGRLLPEKNSTIRSSAASIAAIAAIAATAVTAATAAKTAPRVSARVEAASGFCPAGFRRGDGARAAPGGCVGLRGRVRVGHEGNHPRGVSLVRARARSRCSARRCPSWGNTRREGSSRARVTPRCPSPRPCFSSSPPESRPGSCQSWAPSSARCAARPGPPRRTRRGPRCSARAQTPR